MISSFIIMFRETLEAALVIGILLIYLHKSGKARYDRVVIPGALLGIFISIVVAYLFISFPEGFTGRAEQIFEGIAMMTGAVLLTSMILWMMRKKHSSLAMEIKTEQYIAKGQLLSPGSLAGISVLREGVETVVFLSALSFSSGSSIAGSAPGITEALFPGFLIFSGSKKVNLNTFFLITNILLILFAAGLIAKVYMNFRKQL